MSVIATGSEMTAVALLVQRCTLLAVLLGDRLWFCRIGNAWREVILHNADGRHGDEEEMK